MKPPLAVHIRNVFPFLIRPSSHVIVFSTAHRTTLGETIDEAGRHAIHVCTPHRPQKPQLNYSTIFIYSRVGGLACTVILI